LVILNRGSFTGASLGKFIGKQYSGLKVSEWYAEEEYASIQEYIEDEADGFIKLYQLLVQRSPDTCQEFTRGSGILI
tara:strand:+ start:457 stop:687 length:231 start_codon:yes stop_codon:yes gene_type:complete